MQQPDTRLALIKEHFCVLTNVNVMLMVIIVIVKVLKIKNDRKKTFLLNVQNFSLA